MRIPLLITTSILVVALTSCASLESAITELDTALEETVRTSPVTGEAVANIVSEAKEIAKARRARDHLQSEYGSRFDPPGARLQQLQRILARLLEVSHRQNLSWEAHLIDDPTPNAFTPGGGQVFFYTGLFQSHPAGNGFVYASDDEIAAVMAHEIAHVALLHVGERVTSAFLDKRSDDAYYRAAYTNSQEDEADKLAALYMVLAGFDPRASPRIWLSAHAKFGSDPGLFLYSHPLNDQRMANTDYYATQVLPYYKGVGEKNQDWAAVLDDNPFFKRVQARSSGTGSGIAKAAEAILAGKAEHDRAKREAEQRERAANQRLDSAVQLLNTQADPQGRPLIWMQFYNGSPRNVRAIGVTISYVNAQNQELANDPKCGGPAELRPGETKWLSCNLHPVNGATQYQVHVTGVEFY